VSGDDTRSGVKGPSEDDAVSDAERVDGVRLMVGKPSLGPQGISDADGILSSHRDGIPQGRVV